MRHTSIIIFIIVAAMTLAACQSRRTVEKTSESVYTDSSATFTRRYIESGSMSDSSGCTHFIALDSVTILLTGDTMHGASARLTAKSMLAAHSYERKMSADSTATLTTAAGTHVKSEASTRLDTVSKHKDRVNIWLPIIAAAAIVASLLLRRRFR